LCASKPSHMAIPAAQAPPTADCTRVTASDIHGLMWWMAGYLRPSSFAAAGEYWALAQPLMHPQKKPWTIAAIITGIHARFVCNQTIW
jgi:hypothetical protein